MVRLVMPFVPKVAPAPEYSAIVSRLVLNRVDDLVCNVHVRKGMLIQSSDCSRTDSFQLSESLLFWDPRSQHVTCVDFSIQTRFGILLQTLRKLCVIKHSAHIAELLDGFCQILKRFCLWPVFLHFCSKLRSYFGSSHSFPDSHLAIRSPPSLPPSTESSSIHSVFCMAFRCNSTAASKSPARAYAHALAFRP